jgi:hypothetical protein
VRPIRHRLARIAAVAALLLTIAVAFASPAKAWDGDTLILPDSVDDGGVTLPAE